jgi:hypothetical protein
MSPHWRLADHTEVDPRRHRRPSRLAIGSRVAHDLRYHCAKANRILTDSSSRQHNSGSEVADRDPDTIKRDIDQARDQLWRRPWIRSPGVPTRGGLPVT